MSSDSDGGVEHEIRAVAVVEEERRYHVYESEGEVKLEFSGEVRDYRLQRQKMYRCTCGAGKFRTDETVLRHLREVGHVAE